MKIRFSLNGSETEIDTPPDRRVVDILREDLGLVGTKEGCGAGECGACTIFVNNEPKLSCLMLAAQLEDAQIITIEGVATEENLHPVQQAFIETGAVQCGFCTPGMIITSMALLQKYQSPDRETIREALGGNICRCTGYQKIVDAVETAAESMGKKEAL